MTEKEEKYNHLESCMQDLNKAWTILQTIKTKNDQTPFVGYAFELALIVYSKPYKVSYGTLLDSKNKPIKYKLDEKYIPNFHLDLHSRILKARDQIHAHSDLTVQEAKLYVSKIGNEKIFTIVQNKILATQEFENIDGIIDLIEKTLDNLYLEIDLLKTEIPTNFTNVKS